MDNYIGLMSGTSIDGIDAVIVNFDQGTSIVASEFTPYQADTRDKIKQICSAKQCELETVGELDHFLGKLFADAVNSLLKKAQLKPESIMAIGSHGQTIRHRPSLTHPFTMQIGDPNIIAAQTSITTVGDFRRKDMALGGQGAPLVPTFHQAQFANNLTDTIIINIGGIANITLLPANSDDIIGFDTGPGNTLLDSWIQKELHTTFDKNGDWAKSGQVQAALLSELLSDPYFKLKPPKSTGREHFHLDWLEQHLKNSNTTFKPEDIQSTLAELTAVSILDAIKQHIHKGEIYVCGGGASNTYLMQRLQTLAGDAFKVTTTEAKDIHPDWVEATAFAWLAKQTMNKKPGNHPKVTGASRASILGGIYYP